MRKKKEEKIAKRQLKVVVLMAGLGSRFSKLADINSEYLKPKPFINVHGKPMVYWATSSLPFIQHKNQDSIKTDFVVRDEDIIAIMLEKDSEYIKELKKWYGEKIQIILVKELTRGAAETALMAKQIVTGEESVLFLDSDNFYDGSNFYRSIVEAENAFDCLISVFQPNDNDPKWSYALHVNGDVLEINEKDSVLMKKGADAIIGSFYFPSAEDFFNEVELMIKENDLSGPEGKQEFYMSQICRRFLIKGKKIKAVKSDAMWGLGTPDDLEYFLKNYEP